MQRSANHTDASVKRNLRDNSEILRKKLGKLQSKKKFKYPADNYEEDRYKLANYAASFHKGLQHDANGLLLDTSNYRLMRNSILENNQQNLAGVALAANAVGKLVNPLAANSAILVGIPQNSVRESFIPRLSSIANAIELLELYSQQLTRDVSFDDYSINPILQRMLDINHMNSADIISNLSYTSPINEPFTTKTLFRGVSDLEQVGPYISQFLYLDVPMGAAVLKQKYKAPKSVSSATSRVEWGVSRNELVLIQNTDLNNPALPPQTNPVDIEQKYIYSGRGLAEAVHNDPAYQFFYQASLIMAGLGIRQNPGFPIYPNQAPFITNGGGPNIQCCIAEVTGLALKHSWYWKWAVSRKARPEAQSILVDIVKNNSSQNEQYGFHNVLLGNIIMDDVKIYNSTAPYNQPNSYTLSTTYREGSPLHPAWPSGHATIAGAAVTVLKIFFDGSTQWKSLAAVMSGKLSNGVAGPVEANPADNFDSLRNYTDTDSDDMTVNGELEKLASNVGIGRNWAGIHYRSDAIGGILLGETIAIKYMEDMLSTSVERNLDKSIPKISIRKFDGTTYTLIPTYTQ